MLDGVVRSAEASKVMTFRGRGGDLGECGESVGKVWGECGESVGLGK